jgi:hypothetical protein
MLFCFSLLRKSVSKIPMNFLRVGLFLMGLGLGITVVKAETPQAYEVGEKLTYHFYYGPFMVGRGTFEVVEKRTDGTIKFSVIVKSNDFISHLYPVDDDITSVYDPIYKRSVDFQQDRKEGETHTWEETFFFYKWAHGQMISYNTGEIKWFDIPKTGVQDKLSTIYYMRDLDWDQRKEAKVTLGNDKRNYDVVIKKLGKETVKTDDFNSIPTFTVEPNTEYLGGFVKKGKMRAWVSDDHYKIPVRVEAKLPFGTVSSALVKVQGVKGWPYAKDN